MSLLAIIRGHEQHSDACDEGLEVLRTSERPKKTLEERFHVFQEGRWLELLALSRGIEASAHQSSVRRRRRQRQDDGIQRRVDRAHSLVRLGELSAVRQALEGANNFEGIDKPSPTPTSAQTRIEPRDFAI